MGADRKPKQVRRPKPEVLQLGGSRKVGVKTALGKGKPPKASPKKKRRSK